MDDARTTLTVAETFGGKLQVLEIAHGEPVTRAIIDVSTGPARHPDGIASDPDGLLWFADVHTGTVARIGPEGSVDRLVATGKTHATSCCFAAFDDVIRVVVTAGDHTPAPGNEANGSGVILAVPFESIEQHLAAGEMRRGASYDPARQPAHPQCPELDSNQRPTP